MRTLTLIFVFLLAFASLPLRADEPGQFDYWLLSLSWSPQYCENRENDQQCQRPYAFVVHGLWPQKDRGYPEDCGSGGERVSRELVERMLPLMPSPRLIQHEWRSHGTCSALGIEDYFLTIERVRRDLNIPSAYTDPTQYLSTTADDITGAFAQANPGLGAEDMILICAGHYLKEVRICYGKDFKFQICGVNQRSHCGHQIVLRPSR
ncbi:MAG: ribonuclease T2 family protein [Stenotrophobium sp.]